MSLPLVKTYCIPSIYTSVSSFADSRERQKSSSKQQKIGFSQIFISYKLSCRSLYLKLVQNQDLEVESYSFREDLFMFRHSLTYFTLFLAIFARMTLLSYTNLSTLDLPSALCLQKSVSYFYRIGLSLMEQPLIRRQWVKRWSQYLYLLWVSLPYWQLISMSSQRFLRVWLSQHSLQTMNLIASMILGISFIFCLTMQGLMYSLQIFLLILPLRVQMLINLSMFCSLSLSLLVRRYFSSLEMRKSWSTMLMMHLSKSQMALLIPSSSSCLIDLRYVYTLPRAYSSQNFRLLMVKGAMMILQSFFSCSICRSVDRCLQNFSIFLFSLRLSSIRPQAFYHLYFIQARESRRCSVYSLLESRSRSMRGLQYLVTLYHPMTLKIHQLFNQHFSKILTNSSYRLKYSSM